MQPARVLASWVGMADYRSMLADLLEGGRPRLQALVKKGPEVRGGRPVRALLDSERFGEVHLLVNDPPELARRYVQWLKVPRKQDPSASDPKFGPSRLEFLHPLVRDPGVMQAQRL